MSPYPLDPTEATGPMRLVVTALPEGRVAERIVRGALRRKLAACAQAVAARSSYWWRGRLADAAENVVWFKTTPKRVGALFGYLAKVHPYEVPEILEVDVARVHGPYLAYLARILEPDGPPPPLGGGGAVTPRRAGRRVRGASPPGRTRGRPRRR